MKKIFFNIKILFTGLILLSSCGEDFLDRYPPQQLTRGNFYQTEDDMMMAANSVYNQMYGIWGSGALPYIYGDMYGGDSYLLITVGTAADWQDLADFVADPGNGIINGQWNGYYHRIFRVNDFLEELELFGLDNFRTPGLANRLKAEALFVRAANYYYLAYCFGDVPLVTRVLLPDEAKELTRDPESQVIAKVIEDLEFAVANLPDTYPSSDVGRVTSHAARAMLARVHMSYGDNSRAEPLLRNIIQSGLFTLDANLDGEVNAEDWSYIFHHDTKNTPGVVFELQYLGGTDGRSHTYTSLYTPLGGIFPPPYTDRLETWGIGAVHPNLYNAFEPDDSIRKMISVRMYEGDTYMPHTWKYIHGYADGVPYRISSNVNVIRYAEILLNYAEITNDPQYLNMVRHSHGLPGWGEPGYPVDEHPTFALALEHERRLEFSFEFQRGFDLRRTGRLLEVKGEELGRTIPAHRIRFPIPDRVLDLHPNMQQTDGYQ